MSDAEDLEKGGDDSPNIHKIEPFEIKQNLDRPSSAALVAGGKVITAGKLNMYDTQRRGFGLGLVNENAENEDDHAEIISYSKKLGFHSDDGSDISNNIEAQIDNYSIDESRKIKDYPNAKTKQSSDAKLKEGKNIHTCYQLHLIIP